MEERQTLDKEDVNTKRHVAVVFQNRCRNGDGLETGYTVRSISARHLSFEDRDVGAIDEERAHALCRQV